MKIVTKFDIDQPIHISELDCLGRIKRIIIDRRGTQYEVRYFDRAEARVVLFYEDEIKQC